MHTHCSQCIRAFGIFSFCTHTHVSLHFAYCIHHLVTHFQIDIAANIVYFFVVKYAVCWFILFYVRCDQKFNVCTSRLIISPLLHYLLCIFMFTAWKSNFFVHFFLCVLHYINCNSKFLIQRISAQLPKIYRRSASQYQQIVYEFITSIEIDMYIENLLKADKRQIYCFYS